MRGKTLGVLLASAAALPLVAAAGIDWQPVAQAVGNMWNLIGALFSFQYVSTNCTVRQGILYFLLFILLLRVVQVGAKKVFDQKTSTIIGVVVALVTIWFTPNGMIFSGIVAVALYMMITIGLTYLSFFSDWFTKKGWIGHLMGVLVMLVNTLLATNLLELYKAPLSSCPASIGSMPAFVTPLLNFIAALVVFLTVVRMFSGMFQGKGPGDGKTGGDTTSGKTGADTGAKTGGDTTSGKTGTDNGGKTDRPVTIDDLPPELRKAIEDAAKGGGGGDGAVGPKNVLPPRNLKVEL